MNRPRIHELSTLLFSCVALPLSTLACGDDSQPADANPPAVADAGVTGVTCESVGRALCARACECANGAGCRVTVSADSGASGAVVYDDRAHCESFYVTLACGGATRTASALTQCNEDLSRARCLAHASGSGVEMPAACAP